MARGHDVTTLAHAARQGFPGTALGNALRRPILRVVLLASAVVMAIGSAISIGGVLFVAAVIAGLLLIGVRDWRCIALALASWPFVFGFDMGNLGPFILFGIGMAWHYRGRVWPPALAIASIIIAKLFPWTLLGWLLVTRRIRTLALTVTIALGAVIVGWAVIGFAGFTDYPRMLSDLSNVERGAGASLVSTLLATGLPGTAAEVLSLAVALAMLSFAYRCARRPSGDAQALGLAVIAALVCSPIVWPHYFVLLFVPIGLASPRLSPVWFTPLLTVVVSVPTGIIELLAWIALAALAGWVLCRPHGAAAQVAFGGQRQASDDHVSSESPPSLEPGYALAANVVTTA